MKKVTLRLHSLRCMWLALLLAMALVWTVPLATAQRTPEYEPQVVVVQFDSTAVIAGGSNKTGLQDFDRRAAAYSVHAIKRVFPFLDHVQPTPKTARNLAALRRTYYVRYHATVAPKHVARMLSAAPGVVYAEPVVINRIFDSDPWERVDPNDPLFSDQTYLGHLRLTEAWDEVKGEDGSAPAVIAVVDGGGEWRHEDLRGNVWTNPNEIQDNGVDDDNNGFIDDMHGVNFPNGDDSDNDPTGLPHTPGSANHGTAVAGTANAVTNNDVGVAGAAWNAEVMHINAGCSHHIADGYICYGYEGVLYAAANGADVINVSWGALVEKDERVRFIDETLHLATDMGALVVAAAGNASLNNDLFLNYPARHPRVLSVGATNKDSRTKSGFSNYGKLVNVFAPGESIATTRSDNRYTTAGGTSFSSPLVAGVAALVKTKFPGMSPDALREQVRLTSESMDAENPGLAGHLGHGFVNALAAIREPAVPAVRLKRWSWIDSDGDSMIASGDQVTITATVGNHLADAQQLKVALVAAGDYPFLDMTMAEADIGSLAGGDSTEVTLTFSVNSSAPSNQPIRFFIRIRDGAHQDEADMISLGVNRSLDAVHQSLSALYIATDGDNWRRNTNWDITSVPTEEELATWEGVVLHQGWLVGLRLDYNDLTGVLPAELGNLAQLQILTLEGNTLSGALPPELGDLEQLAILDLNYNDLAGTIPPELGNLTQLSSLDLSSNDLSGAIPPELGNLTQLSSLDLRSNDLAGAIPGELGDLTQLNHLWLYDNSLSGAIPPELGNLTQLNLLWLGENSLSGAIPPELGDLAQLTRLGLWRNSLSGAIPPELGNLTQLNLLWLGGNSLSGAIPPELGNLKNLFQLSLSDNSLTGTIPPELGNLRRLYELYLGNNSLTGTIPPELGNLTRLTWLSLHSNSLTGTIPPELGNLTRLYGLNLSHNSLTGTIPPELGNLRRLYELYLGNNSLTGTIPPELGNLTRLRSLFLGHNSLTGTIPPELGNLEELWRVGLSSNSLTGTIPPELGNPKYLYELALSENSLTGTIPPELGNLTQLRSLFLGHNSLTGTIPPELGKLTRLRSLFLGHNSLTGTIPPELGKLTQLAQLDLSYNVFKGRLPMSLMQLTDLRYLYFGGQSLCAPQDAVFQEWLSSVESTWGPTCTGLHLASGVEDRIFTKGVAITALILAERADGTAPYTYTLNPALPAGLVLDHGARTISGTPTVTANRAAYTYTVTDADATTASQTFGIEVVTGVAFADVVSDQSLPLAQPITPLVLPEATGGAPPLDYTLAPALPEGLTFDDNTRTISGTPTVVAATAPYVFKATGANGSTDNLVFSMKVYSPGDDQHDGLPATFALHGNYPNPFQRATQIVFDLPWQADVAVDVLDVLGRRMLLIPSQPISGGWERSIDLSGINLPSGLYLYRVHASAQEGEGDSMLVGRFVRIR